MEPGQKESPAANGAEKFTRHHRTNSRAFPQDIAVAFKAALDKAGLPTKDKITAGGKMHRFTVEGDKPGSKNGWYILYDDSLPAGAYGCWKRGISETWCLKPDQQMTAAERVEFSRRMIEARKAREAEEEARRRAAREKAAAIWQAAPPAPDNHPYLAAKGVRNHGLRQHNRALVIPLRDSYGILHSLQFIDGTGNKRFLSGGRIQGCYFAIGSPIESLCIAEGYATAASINESTHLPVAVAFNCGNLLPVAQALRAKFKTIEIILCADNDTRTPGNPGLTKAMEAAAAVGARLAVPSCHGDFNDLYRGAGQ